MVEEEQGVAEVAKNVLETLLNLMEVSATITPVSEPLVGEENETVSGVTLDIKGEDLGILIGRRGQTLTCLQYLVRLMVGHRTKLWLPIVIDVEGYKRRRQEALQALALRIAEQVKTRKVPFALEPMPPFDRRIIHLALADNPDVTTQSNGEGEARKVVIIPREKL